MCCASHLSGGMAAAALMFEKDLKDFEEYKSQPVWQ